MDIAWRVAGLFAISWLLGCGPYPTEPGHSCGAYGLNAGVKCPAPLVCSDNFDCTWSRESCAQDCARPCAQSSDCQGSCVCASDGLCRAYKESTTLGHQNWTHSGC